MRTTKEIKDKMFELSEKSQKASQEYADFLKSITDEEIIMMEKENDTLQNS